MGSSIQCLSKMIHKIEITDELDLHHFNPSEVKELLNEYIFQCLEKEILSIRIIHGKGKGILRDRVHKILKKNKNVLNFYPAPPSSGFWGATIAELKKSRDENE